MFLRKPQPADARNSRSYARRLLTLVALHKRRAIAIILASLLLNLCGLAAPRFTQAILDDVVPRGDFTLLAQLVSLLALVTGLQIALSMWRRIALVRLSFGIDRLMLREFCGHLLSLPVQFFKERQVGDLVSRFQDQGYVRHLFSGSLMRGAIDSVMVLVYLAVMMRYSVSLTLVVLVPLVAFAGFTLFMTPVLKRSHRGLQEAQGAYEAHLIEALTSIDLVKGMSFERAVQARWEALLEDYLGRNERVQRLKQVLESGRTAIQFVSTVVLFWYGAVLVVGGALSTGQLVAFSLYAGQALPPILSVIALWDDWQQARSALERMQEVIDQQPEPQLPAEARRYPERIEGDIRFEGVRFRYDAGAPEILSRISFTLKRGERVALVGRSGCGKTTVARLLLGLYRPTDGRVLVDGTDLREIDLATYRRNVAIVLQENLLIAATIAENIALDDPKPNRERIIEAALSAEAHGFIAALPEGYDTRVGELGLTLSAGERQRVSLARGLYRDPRILILDEATSALDSRTEADVLRNLHRVLADRATLLIAHRLSTVQSADRILVIADGRIVEEGNHAELLAKDGAYRALCSSACLSS